MCLVILHLYCSVFLLATRKALFDPVEEDPNYNPLPEDRPGGFDWGAPRPPQQDQPEQQPPPEPQPRQNDGHAHAD